MRKLLLFSALLVIIDQVTKVAVKGFNLFGIRHEGMQLYESHQVLGDFLRWTFVENPGMAFGLNFGMPVVLGLFSIGASIFLIYLMKRTEKDGTTGLRIALAMILGGAVGNLIDRVFYGVFYDYAPLFYGRVVDFVDINIPDFSLFGLNLERFYIFNIADAAVSVGVILLLIFYPAKKEPQTVEPAGDGDGAAKETGSELRHQPRDGDTPGGFVVERPAQIPPVDVHAGNVHRGDIHAGDAPAPAGEPPVTNPVPAANTPRSGGNE